MSNKVLVFTSPTCGPCKRLKPELIEQAEKRGFPLEIVELSDDNRSLFTERGIRAVPVTICVNESGETVGQFAGQLPATALEAKLVEWGL